MSGPHPASDGGSLPSLFHLGFTLQGEFGAPPSPCIIESRGIIAIEAVANHYRIVVNKLINSMHLFGSTCISAISS